MLEPFKILEIYEISKQLLTIGSKLNKIYFTINSGF